MSHVDQPLGQLARQIPGATAVFHAHELDFCCGGRKSLRDAAAERGLKAEPIAAELRALPSAQAAGVRDWGRASQRELMNHILVRYHAVHRQQLPELIRLARKVEQVHGDRPDCPHGLAEHLYGMQQELESHMQKEEQVLFPMLSHGRGAQARMPMEVMRLEHDHHGEALQRLAALATGFVPPRAACTTWRALYLGLRTLRDDLMEHIHLENNVLFENAARPPLDAARETAQA